MVKAIAWIVTVASVAWVYWEVKQHSEAEARHRRHDYIDAREGDAVCRPDHKPWNTSGKGAFVIAVSGGCKACEVIRPLEARVDEYGRVNGVPTFSTFYIVDEGAKSEKLAHEFKAAGRAVVRIDFLKFGVNKVPTLIRLNDVGTIQAMWVGAPPDARRDEAFDLVTAGRTDRGYEVVPSAELAAYVANPNYQILALADTGRRKDRAKVMPFADLSIRAKYELNPDLGVAVDCGSSAFAETCQDAARLLVGLKFRRVVAVGLPHRPASCF